MLGLRDIPKYVVQAKMLTFIKTVKKFGIAGFK